MRIGIATHNYPPHLGGLETIVREQACGFARRHDVIVVSTAWQGCQGIRQEDGVTVHRLSAWHLLERAGVPYAVPTGPGVRSALDELADCDVLHAHGCLYPTTILAAEASRRRQSPFFITEHVGIVPYGSRVLAATQAAAWHVIGAPLVRRADRVITYNARVHDALAERFGRDRVTFIQNGVDTTVFRHRTEAERGALRKQLGLPSDEVLALFVGRAAAKKNLDSVLQFPAKNYRLVVCGAVRSLPPHVINLGALPHSLMSDVFGAADFLLHAAVGEGFPVAVQEAFGCGLPVVLLWDSGYEGSVSKDVLVAVSHLGELSSATERLAVDKAMRDELGAKAQSFAVDHWSWETTIERHLDLFHGALSKEVRP